MCEQLIQRLAYQPMYRDAAVRLRAYHDKLDSLSSAERFAVLANQDLKQINTDRALLADAMSRLMLEGSSNGN